MILITIGEQCNDVLSTWRVTNDHRRLFAPRRPKFGSVLALAVALLVIAVGHCAAALECPELIASSTQYKKAPYAHGILWRVESPGHSISHVFGTIHLSDPRVTELPPKVAEIFQGSDSFGMEVLLDADAILEMSAAMFYSGNQSLEKDIDPDLFDDAVELLGRYGVSAEVARRLKPWSAFTTLSLPPGKAGAPLDLLLLTLAEQGGKSVFGLESIKEQVDVFERLTMSDQRDLLAEAVCHYDEFQTEIEEMIGHYLAQDLDAMMRMSMRYRSPMHDRFMDSLLWQRNRRLAERMLPHLQQGGAFIAIGALHLPGIGGVLDLLNKRGYAITPIH